MNLLVNYELFLAKIMTFFFIIIFIIFLFINIRKRKNRNKGRLKFTLLEEKYKTTKNELLLSKMSNHEKKIYKDKIKKRKHKNKNIKRKTKILYVLDFKGGVYANEVAGLREEISAVISVANKDDEVLLRLESAGGVIHGYGLAASQLQRLRQKGIYLSVCIDKIAASGGYMMACVANDIISAPFAIIGSIGVVGQIPNFNKLLKKCYVDVELHTAGDYKRTLTIFGKNTDHHREKFQEELNSTHELFKNFIQKMRPSLDIESVSSGEHWFGSIALQKKLVDRIKTSDDILIEKMKEYTVLNIKYIYAKTMLERFSSSFVNKIGKMIIKVFFYKHYL